MRISLFERDSRDGRRFDVRSSRFSELRTQNFELRIAPIAYVPLVSAGGSAAWGVGFSGWGCRRCRWSFRSGLRGLFLFEVDHRGGKRSFSRHDGEAQRGEHEDGRDDDREFAQEVGRTTAPEHGLTGASERRADLSALARL